MHLCSLSHSTFTVLQVVELVISFSINLVTRYYYYYYYYTFEVYPRIEA